MARARNNEKAITVKVLAFVIFLFYIYLLIKNSIFTRLIAKNYMRSISIVPFKSNAFNFEAYRDGLSIMFSTGFKTLIGPIIMFIPLGFLLPFIIKGDRHFFKIFYISFFSSLSLELLQYITKTGISSIDDLLLNVIGATLGYLFYKVLRFAFIYS